MRKLVAFLLATGVGLAAACSSDTTGTNTSDTATQQGAPVGGACASTADCDTGETCAVDDPGGQCVKVCASASDCPSGTACTEEGKCYVSCSTPADCTRKGYTCVDSMTIGMEKNRTCDVAPDPGSGEIGDACVATTDCKTGEFCSPAPTDPNGQCLQTCHQASDCPAGSTCTDEMKCYKSCAQSSDCPRVGYDCVDSMTSDGQPSKTCDTP